MPGVGPRYQAFVLDMLAPLHVAARQMFGGVGLFHGGVMFGMLARDMLYLRVDNGTRPRFEQAGSRPFSYMRRGHEVSLSAYYAVPEVLFDQPDELLRWAHDAVGAARAVRRR